MKWVKVSPTTTQENFNAVITIAGRIARDAELRNAGNDKVCGFTVAVDQREKGEKTTNWYRVSIWGKRGETLAQYLTKGSSVTVVGEFSVSEYDGKQQLNIRASEIALQGGKHDGGSSNESREPARRTPDGSRGAPVQQPAFGGDLNDDIPFCTNEGIW